MKFYQSEKPDQKWSVELIMKDTVVDVFPMSPYLNTHQEFNFKDIFDPVNMFFERLSDIDRFVIKQSLYRMSTTIEAYFKLDTPEQSVQDMVQVLGTMLDDLDRTMDLCEHIAAFVMVWVNFKDTQQKAMGLDHIDSKELLEIAILTKMLSPIFSLIMLQLDQTKDAAYKEGIVVPIFVKLFTRKYDKMLTKLSTYNRVKMETCWEEILLTNPRIRNKCEYAFYKYAHLLTHTFVKLKVIEPCTLPIAEIEKYIDQL